MDNCERFLSLVEKYNGIEFVLGFRDDEDHIIGGKGNKVWYYIQKKNYLEFWMAEFKNGSWDDTHVLSEGENFTMETCDRGTALKKIAARAFYKQREIEESGYKPVMTEYSGYPNRHYSFSFGERAYDILDEYGITASYSNISDETAGWRLRSLSTGDKVEVKK